VAALKQATSTIPIVFAAAGDPVGNGLVASLARPGGNVTGLSLLQAETAGKRLELLREMVPGLRRLAIMGNFSNPPIGLELDEVKEMTNKIGLELASHDIRRPEDIALAFDALKGRAQALYVAPDALIIPNRTRIIILAVGARLPAIFNSRESSKREPCFPMDRTSRTCSVAQPTMSTRFYAGRNQTNYRSSSRPCSILPST